MHFFSWLLAAAGVRAHPARQDLKEPADGPGQASGAGRPARRRRVQAAVAVTAIAVRLLAGAALDLLRRRLPATAPGAIAAPSARTARVLAATVLMSSVALVATPGISNADNAPLRNIYFSETFTTTGAASIGSAVLPGGEMVHDHLVPDVADTSLGLAVGNGYIYWIDIARRAIGRANLDGTGANPDFITGVFNGCGLAVDGGHIYWGNADNTTFQGQIGRANLDGTGVNQAFLTPPGLPCGVTVDAAHIYWSNLDQFNVFLGGGLIGRANLDGTGVDPNFITAPGTFQYASGVAVNGGNIYWSEPGHNRIGRANLDGTAVVQTFITTATPPDGVAVDATYIYWVNAEDVRTKSKDYGQTIGRANLDGTAVNQHFINAGTVNTPFGTVTDHAFSKIVVSPTP